MSERLQEFDFKSSPYLRPTQEWVCGRLSEGCPCQIGPDDKGNCRATFECRPRRDGDRWVCTRSTFAGGSCPEGPRPDGTCCREIPKCRPVRSWRARRGATAKWVAAVVAALVLITLAGAARPWFLNPGALTTKHAELGSCADCHSAFDMGPVHWVHAAFAESRAQDDSRRCLGCHGLGEDSFSPHGLSPAKLQGLTAKARPAAASLVDPTVPISSALFDLPQERGEPLLCATCHSEHHGMDAELTEMSNVRCASCHSAKFTSLAEGHPDFDGYPYQRRTRIAFDHTSHIDKHFNETKYAEIAPKQCKSCHEPDADGKLMEVRSFDTVCASCHAGQIEGDGRSGALGLAVFSAPGLDFQGLQDHDAPIGEWPEFSEAEVTPFMDFLLSQDEGYVQARATLKDVDLLDLTDATPEQLAAVETLVWTVKGLLFDLRLEGVATLRPRLEKAIGRTLTSAEVTRLVALLPPDAVEAAQVAWFPNLMTEVPRHRAGQRVSIPGAPPEPMQAQTEKEDTGSSSGTLDQSNILGGDEKDQSSILGGEEKDQSDILGGDKDQSDILGGDEKDQSDILGGDEKNQSDILGGDEKADILGGDKDQSDILGGDSKDQSDILGGDDKIGSGDEAGKEKAEVEVAPAVEIPPAEERASAGGWYRDYFVLRYRPTGHADAFLRSWLDVTVVAAATQPAAAEVFESLADHKAVGFCAKCHSIDIAGDTPPKVNWQAYRSEPNVQNFTTFSHTAHFSLMGEKGCRNCHIRDRDADYAASFKDRDPSTFASNFATMDRQTCAECHVPSKAGDSCLNCHNYHVGRFPPTVISIDDMRLAIER